MSVVVSDRIPELPGDPPRLDARVIEAVSTNRATLLALTPFRDVTSISLFQHIAGGVGGWHAVVKSP